MTYPAGMRGTDARRLVLGILLPAVLLLHTLCLCAGAAPDARAHESMAAASACPDHRDDAPPERSPFHRGASSCPHCDGEASLVVAAPPIAPPAAGLAAPHVATLLQLRVAAPVIGLRIMRPATGPPSPAVSVLSRSAVLRI